MSALKAVAGRPSKMHRWMEAFRGVIEGDHPVGMGIVLREADLVAMTNEGLDEGDRISMRTFDRWKAGELKDEGALAVFRGVYEGALRRQKLALFAAMMDKDNERSWTKLAWVIERRFDDWNLRAKSVDETQDVKQLVLRVK